MTGPMSLKTVDDMVAMHDGAGFRLAFGRNNELSIHTVGDPIAVVTELLRLARMGAIAEAIAPDQYGMAIGLFVETAQADWAKMQVR